LAGTNIREAPARPDLVRFREGFGQRFVLTVDTEEEFDWSQPLEREGHSLHTVPMLRKFQQFCEGFGVVPIYLVDYPVANSPVAAEVLGPAVREGRAEIGVQLHPWVSPPHLEDVSEHNSFAGNLPPELEREKFMRLRDAIEQNLGAPPRIYRAGRYGVGPSTAAILVDGGIAIDTSVRARFDYSYAGGPNFRDHPLEPYWLDRAGGLVELPLTTVFWGPLRQIGEWLYPRLWRMPSLRGALARVGLLERIPLTPEGVTAEEAMRGIDIAVDSGLPVLVLSFHSPSLAPGYSPYVSSEADLDRFYDWWRTIFACLERRGVKPASVSSLMDAVTLASPPPPG
jgi:hypothetical protein